MLYFVVITPVILFAVYTILFHIDIGYFKNRVDLVTYRLSIYGTLIPIDRIKDEDQVRRMLTRMQIRLAIQSELTNLNIRNFNLVNYHFINLIKKKKISSFRKNMEKYRIKE